MGQINILLQRRNEIDAEIAAIENNMVAENAITLVKEILNLLSGVGEGYVPGDCYAPDRYYSKIEGVKNLRLIDGGIYVKVTAPSGYLLPGSVRIGDNTYVIRFNKSFAYFTAVDY